MRNRTNSPTKPRIGTTLLELMFAVAGSAIVIGTVLAVYMVGIKSYRADAGRNQANNAALHAVEYIKHDLRNSSGIEAGYGSYTTSSSTICIVAPSYDNYGVMDGVYDHIIYRISSNKLVRTVYPASGSARPAETDGVIVRRASSLSFTYVAHDSFTADGTARSFTLSTYWTAAPACRFNGDLLASGVSYNSSAHTASFSNAPAAGSVMEFIYQVSPSQSGAIVTASEVRFTVDAEPDGSLDGSAHAIASAKLRNK